MNLSVSDGHTPSVPKPPLLRGGGICEANDGEVNNVSDGHILFARAKRNGKRKSTFKGDMSLMSPLKIPPCRRVNNTHARRWRFWCRQLLFSVHCVFVVGATIGRPRGRASVPPLQGAILVQCILRREQAPALRRLRRGKNPKVTPRRQHVYRPAHISTQANHFRRSAPCTGISSKTS